MRSGNPTKKIIKDVEVGGRVDLKIRTEHEVIYVSDNEVQNNGTLTYSITHCDEKPSKKVCGECCLRGTCNFSEAPKLRG